MYKESVTKVYSGGVKRRERKEERCDSGLEGQKEYELFRRGADVGKYEMTSERSNCSHQIYRFTFPSWSNNRAHPRRCPIVSAASTIPDKPATLISSETVTPLRLDHNAPNSGRCQGHSGHSRYRRHLTNNSVYTHCHAGRNIPDSSLRNKGSNPELWSLSTWSEEISGAVSKTLTSFEEWKPISSQGDPPEE